MPMPDFPIAYAESLILSADKHATALNALIKLPEDLRQERPNLVQIIGATASQIILGVFAVEVAYKSHIERLGETPKRIHSLEQLHADLPDRTFARKIETEFESVTGTPLASFLSQHKNDFIELRYFFEQTNGQTKQFSLSDVRNLGHILAVQYQAG
jgi:hypothetical protein